jgi:hypothetical protein
MVRRVAGGAPPRRRGSGPSDHAGSSRWPADRPHASAQRARVWAPTLQLRSTSRRQPRLPRRATRPPPLDAGHRPAGAAAPAESRLVSGGGAGANEFMRRGDTRVVPLLRGRDPADGWGGRCVCGDLRCGLPVSEPVATGQPEHYRRRGRPDAMRADGVWASGAGPAHYMLAIVCRDPPRQWPTDPTFPHPSASRRPRLAPPGVCSGRTARSCGR